MNATDKAVLIIKSKFCQKKYDEIATQQCIYFTMTMQYAIAKSIINEAKGLERSIASERLIRGEAHSGLDSHY